MVVTGAHRNLLDRKLDLELAFKLVQILFDLVQFSNEIQWTIFPIYRVGGGGALEPGNVGVPLPGNL